MCYNVNYLTKKKKEYARRIQGILKMRDFDGEWEKISKKTVPVYYDNGFNHPDIPVIINHHQEQLQLFTWGLIPCWVKDPRQANDISKRTLNARGEEIFEKPSFRNAARNKRCLVLIDGFFEYHWHKGTSYPFYIKMKDDSPMLLAGLWETWHYEKEDIVRHTFSIVTTSANPLMEYIHNNPKGSKDSRMPVIIPEGLEENWLMDVEAPIDREHISEMVRPFDESELEAYTVPRLKGKEGVGNSPEAVSRVMYEALT